MELQPFEHGRHRNLLAVPMTVALGHARRHRAFRQAPAGFTADDQHMRARPPTWARSCCGRRSANGRRTELLFDAVAAALKASDSMAASLARPCAAGAAAAAGARPVARPGPQQEDAGAAERACASPRPFASLAPSMASRPGALLAMVQQVRVLLDRATGIVLS